MMLAMVRPIAAESRARNHWVALSSSISKNSRTGAAARILDRAEELAAELESDYAIAITEMARGTVAYFDQRWGDALRLSRQAAARFRERCAGTTWEHDTATAFALWSLAKIGDIGELSRICPALVKEAHERGDYFEEPGGRPRHRGMASLAPYVFARVSACDARLFRDPPDGAFSLLQLWNRAEAVGRLFCLIHEGDWCPVGTPEALAAAERALA